MDLTLIIESAEKKYQQVLEVFFISVYKDKSLPSHGLDHHRRVWKNSKELVEFIPLRSSTDKEKLVADLIISSYLHDIGMSVDAGVKHGRHSRDLACKFLDANNLPEKEFIDALEAIENHDNKEYSGNTLQNDLLSVLSVADDLDAFGITGIYRYAEIYLVRQISFQDLGSKIIENASGRFNNLLKIIGSNCEFTLKQTSRYNMLIDFFMKYNEQLPSYIFGSSKPTGYCGIIELIASIAENKTEVNEVINDYRKDPVIYLFFYALKKELEPS